MHAYKYDETLSVEELKTKLFKTSRPKSALMIKEAGGFIGDFSGRDKYMETGNVVAGNSDVYKQILKKIHPHLTEDLQS